MRETVLLKNLRVPNKNILLDANPDIGVSVLIRDGEKINIDGSIHIHGNVELNANLDSSFDEDGNPIQDELHPQFPPDNDTCPYMHKESILTCVEDVNNDFKVIKQEDNTLFDEVSGETAADFRRDNPWIEVGIGLEIGTLHAEGESNGYILLEEATDGD